MPSDDSDYRAYRDTDELTLLQIAYAQIDREATDKTQLGIPVWAAVMKELTIRLVNKDTPTVVINNLSEIQDQVKLGVLHMHEPEAMKWNIEPSVLMEMPPVPEKKPFQDELETMRELRDTGRLIVEYNRIATYMPPGVYDTMMHELGNHQEYLKQKLRHLAKLRVGKLRSEPIAPDLDS